MIIFNRRPNLLKGLFLVLAIFVESSCDWSPSDPSIEIVVLQRDSELIFQFFTVESTWWSRERKQIPHNVYKLMISDSKSILWEVEDPKLHASMNEIRYSVVPAGFEQITPKESRPPALKSGTRYQVVARSTGSGTTSFVYVGKEAS